MPLFSYKAIDRNGKRFNSQVEKENDTQVLEYIIAQGLIPIEVKKLNIFNQDIQNFKIFKSKLGKNNLAIFCRQLSFILDAGIITSVAFDILYRQAQSKVMKNILKDINEGLLKGKSLWECLKEADCFPAFLINMAQVGEQTGRMNSVMDKMADYYEKENKNLEDIKNAMTYPLVVAVMMLCVIVIFMVYVAPNYAQMFLASGIELPMATSILIAFSQFVTAHFFLLVFLIIGGTISLLGFLKSEKGMMVIDWLKLHFFVAKTLYTKMLNLRFAQTLSILLDSGVEIGLSLGIVKNILNNKLLDKQMDDVISKMRQGVSLSFLVEQIPCFEPMLSGMIQIGEETGSMAESLDKCAMYFQRETDSIISRLNKLIEPVITIVLGAVLGFIMLAIMLPTFYMTGAM